MPLLSNPSVSGEQHSARREARSKCVGGFRDQTAPATCSVTWAHHKVLLGLLSRQKDCLCPTTFSCCVYAPDSIEHWPAIRSRAGRVSTWDWRRKSNCCLFSSKNFADHFVFDCLIYYVGIQNRSAALESENSACAPPSVRSRQC